MGRSFKPKALINYEFFALLAPDIINKKQFFKFSFLKNGKNKSIYFFILKGGLNYGHLKAKL